MPNIMRRWYRVFRLLIHLRRAPMRGSGDIPQLAPDFIIVEVPTSCARVYGLIPSKCLILLDRIAVCCPAEISPMPCRSSQYSQATANEPGPQSLRICTCWQHPVPNFATQHPRGEMWQSCLSALDISQSLPSLHNSSSRSSAIHKAIDKIRLERLTLQYDTGGACQPSQCLNSNPVLSENQSLNF